MAAAPPAAIDLLGLRTVAEKDGEEEGNDSVYSWENAAVASWDDLEEDEHGNLKTRSKEIQRQRRRRHVLPEAGGSRRTSHGTRAGPPAAPPAPPSAQRPRPRLLRRHAGSSGVRRSPRSSVG